MRYTNSTILWFLITALGIIQLSSILSSCQNRDSSARYRNLSEEFKNYWYQGKAEINIYDLKQSRYGEIHQGEATLIYVTEDFSESKQVKLDNPGNNQNDKVSVLKLNMLKKFNTGIYPYSMMLSTFSPVAKENVIKITMSSQEWCGQVFSQVNQIENDEYKTQSFSYFESEGDTESVIEVDYWEDEIWNLIRIDYKQLPYGTLRVVPGLFFSRVKHKNISPQVAEGKLFENYDETIHMYQLYYPDLERYLHLRFSSSFPHRIVSWEEGIITDSGDTLKTHARIKSDMFIDYWNRNSVDDLYLRDSLDIEY